MKTCFYLIEKHLSKTYYFCFCLVALGLVFSCNNSSNNLDNKNTQITQNNTGKPTPKLTELNIGNNTREEAYIKENMVFNCEISASNSEDSEVAVSYKTSEPGASVNFDPPLTNGKLPLKDSETHLTIKVGDGDNSMTYKVIVYKISPIYELVDHLTVLGERLKGVCTQAGDRQTNEILQGYEDVVIEVCGSPVLLRLVSFRQIWKVVKINGEDYSQKIVSIPQNNQSFLTIPELKLGAKGEITNVDVFIDCNEEGSHDKPKTRFTLKIKLLDELADIPIENILINGQEQIRSACDQQFIHLQDKSNKPNFKGTDTSEIMLKSDYDCIKSIKINNVDVGEIKQGKDKDGKRDIWYVQHSVTGVTENGKDVHVVIEPKDPAKYSTLNWYFKITKE